MAKKAKDISAMSDDELQKKLGDLNKAQFNLRFQKSTGQLEKTAEIRQNRREIARIKTEQTARAKKAS